MRVFVCPHCGGGDIQFHAVIVEATVVELILRYIKVWDAFLPLRVPPHEGD